MELTKEYFDEQLAGIATRLDGMVTKEDLAAAVKPLATKDELAEAVKPLATKDELAEAIKPLATKDELAEAVKPLATKDELEELERMVADSFAEIARKKDFEHMLSEMREGFFETGKTIDKIFAKIDEDVARRVRIEEGMNQLRTRVEKIENTLRGLNIQEAGL